MLPLLPCAETGGKISIRSGAHVLVVPKMIRRIAASDLARFQLLERVFSEQFEAENVDEGNEDRLLIRQPKDGSCDGLRNPSCPDSSSNAHCWQPIWSM
jgi:hypothetical protein